MREISIIGLNYPVAGEFRIARSTVTTIDVIMVELVQDGHTGRGECRPYPRYGDSPDSVRAEINAIAEDLKSIPDLSELSAYIQSNLKPGPARNALDCAVWDLRAKMNNQPVWQLAGTPEPKARITAYTLSVDTPQNMAKAAQTARDYPVLKLKIKGSEGLDGVQAVMDARPDCQLIIDANESLAPADLSPLHTQLSTLPVLCVEQPIPAGKDQNLGINPNGLPIFCADESMHTSQDLAALWDAGYRAVNVKLDKTGGFTEALKTMRQAQSMGFLIMAGCMVGSSLAMAPMMVLSPFADFIDLDGPLLLARDIDNGLRFDGPKIYPPQPALWG